MPPAERGERPAKRARTDAQLAQKRQADRLKHKSNRAESKTRLENIEKDVSFLRDTISELLGQIRQPLSAPGEKSGPRHTQVDARLSHHGPHESTTPSEKNLPLTAAVCAISFSSRRSFPPLGFLSIGCCHLTYHY